MNWLADTLLVTGVMILAILLVRRPVAYLFGPATAYALWAVPLVRLMLPPLAMPVSADFQVPAPVVAEAAMGELLALPAAQQGGLGYALDTALWAVWLIGVVVFLVWRTWGYLTMRHLLLDGATGVGQAGAVRVLESPATQAPVAFGLFDKVVALPPGFIAGTDPVSRQLAIAHELEHHAGRDLAVNIAMQALFAAHWFNPLAWLGWRALRHDQEAACDARVVSAATPAQRAIYGRLIASFAKSPRLALAAPMACPVLGEASIIHRLRSLTMTHSTTVHLRIGRILIGAALLALPATASITYQAQADPVLTLSKPAETGAVQIVASPSANEAAPAENSAGDDAARPKPRIIFIERSSGHGANESALHTQVIEQDGRSIVIKTAKPLSEAEITQRVGQALRFVPVAPAVSASSDSAASPTAPMPAAASRIMIVRRDAPSGGAGPSSDAVNPCGDKAMARRTVRLADGKTATSVICAQQIDRDALGKAAEAVKSARANIAADKSLNQDIRATILEELDREIARLSTAG